MDKPARVQASSESIKRISDERHLNSQVLQGPNAILNIWYRKWSGGTQKHQQSLSPFRCHLKLDSGKTKSTNPYICLWFARGACNKGSDCSFLHRAPMASDAFLIDGTTDCFGRVKFAENREDMGGVGTSLSSNRTLFVGYFKSTAKNSASLIKKQFAEWGDIEKIQLGKENTIAFITYRSQLTAEFAKEAMSNQTITGAEVSNIRWAHRPHNADTKKISSDIDDKKLREIVKQALLNKSKRNEEISGEEPRSKKPKLI